MDQFATDRDAVIALDEALGAMRRRDLWGDHLGPFPDDDEHDVRRVRAALTHLVRPTSTVHMDGI